MQPSLWGLETFALGPGSSRRELRGWEKKQPGTWIGHIHVLKTQKPFMETNPGRITRG